MQMDDAEKGLLERHLPADPAHSTEAEIEKLSELAPAVRELVLERLKVIDSLAALGGATREDVDRAAMKLGMGRANLYRLMTRVREHGPVVGLTPHARTKDTASAATQGLPPLAEAAVAGILAERPDAPLLDILVAVERAYKETRARMPSEATIRRRLAVLRRPGGISDKNAWETDKRFGRKILVDQCAVAAPTLELGPTSAIVFIVDVETRLVIGCGQSTLAQQSLGLRRAIDQARQGAPTFVVGRFEVEPGPENVRWVVPDDLIAEAEAWGEIASSDETLVTYESGVRRHGKLLVRLMGIDFEGFVLMPRVIGEGLRRLPSIGDTSPRDLTDEINDAAARWNYRILEAASGMEPTLDAKEQSERLEAWRAMQSSDAVKATIEEIIMPFHAIVKSAARLARERGEVVGETGKP